MLRLLVALLALANLLFFAWAQGALSPWLFASPAGDASQREPQRLRAQVRPEAVTLVDAAPARRVCLRAGPFDRDRLDGVERALLRTGVPDLVWQRDSEADGLWWLRLPAVSAAQQATLMALDDPTLARSLQPCP
jgi:hypothetical protein